VALQAPKSLTTSRTRKAWAPEESFHDALEFEAFSGLDLVGGGSQRVGFAVSFTRQADAVRGRLSAADQERLRFDL
jgi:hypothetical protein